MLGDDELSNGERHRPAEIESSLRTDDLEFVQRFEQRQLRRRHDRPTVVALLAISVAVIVIVVALARGNVGAAVVGLISAAASGSGLPAATPEVPRRVHRTGQFVMPPGGCLRQWLSLARNPRPG